MANTYVTDLRHYLDDSEDLADLPGPALKLAMVLTSVVATGARLGTSPASGLSNVT